MTDTPHKTNHPEVVMTGAGLVTCLGLDRETTWRNLCECRRGLGRLTALEQRPSIEIDGGQAPTLPDPENAALSREVRYLRRAIEEAWHDAGLLEEPPYPSRRCGLVLGTTLHGMRSGGRFFREDDPSLLRDVLPQVIVQLATGERGLGGFSITTCSACSSGLSSVALAMDLLRSGELDLVLAGGYDPISEYAYAGFNSLRLVARGPLRPFCRDREGMKLGEGYGIVVLERAAEAHQRGANALAQLRGFGETSDAHHLTQPHPGGEGASRAIEAALADARLSVEDIDLICAHATSTPDNDRGEAAALKHVFGDRLPLTPIVAFKSHLGHTLGGAGAVELILAALARRDGVIPPTANVTPDALEYDKLNLQVGAARSARVRNTVSMALGFGGANTCIVLGEPSHAPAAPTVMVPSKRRDVVIVGAAVIAPGMVQPEAFLQRFTDPHALAETHDTGTIDDDSLAHLLQARRVRRMSEYVKLTLAATTLANQDAGRTELPELPGPGGAILGTMHGSANYSSEYYKQIIDEGIEAANPLLFAEGVPNAGAAQLSLMLGIHGPCQTILGTRTAGLDAVRLSALRIAHNQWDWALVSAADEYAPLVKRAYAACGLAKTNVGQHELPETSTDGFVCGAGAATLVLTSAEYAEKHGFRPRCTVVAAATATWSPNDPRKAIERITEVCRDVRGHGHVMTSVNGTWIDRLETTAISLAAGNDPTTISSPYGYLTECFSALPLAGIASIALTGRMPRMLTDCTHSQNLLAAKGDDRLKDVTVLATDYFGLTTGIRLALD